MYLHVGNSINLRIRNIIGIFDADRATVSQVTKQYLAQAEKKKNIFSTNREIPKSFILYREGKEYKICFSQLSTSALLGRIDELG